MRDIAVATILLPDSVKDFVYPPDVQIRSDVIEAGV